MFDQDKKTGRNRGPLREKSNEYSSVRDKSLIAAKEAEASCGCINIYPMPSVYQSV